MFRNYKIMPNNSKFMTEKLMSPYQQYDMEIYKNRVGLIIIICIVFILFFGVLDVVMYPALATDLISVRVLVDLVLLVLLFLMHRKFINPKIVSFVWSVLVIMLINILIIITGEKSSTPYYAGLNLIIVSSAALLSWTWREMAAICLFLLVGYTLSAIVTIDPDNINLLNIPTLCNNLFFLFSTSCFCVLAAYLNSKLRFQEFHLNYQLKETIEDLKTTRNQLIQSEKINAIGSLSAGLLHEVNNPLNYSLTAVQLLKIDPQINADEDLKDTVKDIEEGMVRIKNIVTDLRAFAYPEEADKKTNFCLRSAVESAIRFTASDCKDIEKIINIDANLDVIGSQTHIVQVLINLISNAAKAIKKSGKAGVIRIETEEKDNRVIVSVTDNGTGMSEDNLRRVFDPFFTTSNIGEGVGMGLSISHTIIKNHNGNLSAESVLGEGSRFFFDLGKS